MADPNEYVVPVGIDLDTFLKSIDQSIEGIAKMETAAKKAGTSLTSAMKEGADASTKTEGGLIKVRNAYGGLINFTMLAKQRSREAADEATKGATQAATATDKQRDALGRFIKTTDEAKVKSKSFWDYFSLGAKQGGKDVDDTKSKTSSLGSIMSKIGGIIGVSFGIIALKQFAQKVFDVRSEFQQLEVAFTTMLQSKEKADKLLADVTKFASVTPFSLTEVATATKQLLAYNVKQEDIIGTLRTLGDVAAGVGSQVGDLVYLYGTLKVSGRVTQTDINQFAGRGIPIYKALAEVLKTNEAGIRNLVSAGKIGFPEIEKAFQNMTKAGSQFGGLMDAQSKTLGGQLSNLGDSFDQLFNDLGKKSEGVFGLMLQGLNDFVSFLRDAVAGKAPDWLQPILDGFSKLYDFVASVVKAVIDFGKTSGVMGQYQTYVKDLAQVFENVVDFAIALVKWIYNLADSIGVVDLLKGALMGAWYILKSFVHTLADLPNIWAGVKAAFAQGIANIKADFKTLIADLEIIALKVRLAFTFDPKKVDELKKKIAELTKQNEQRQGGKVDTAAAFAIALQASRETQVHKKAVEQQAKDKEEAEKKKRESEKKTTETTQKELDKRRKEADRQNKELLRLTNELKDAELAGIKDKYKQEVATIEDAYRKKVAELDREAGILRAKKKLSETERKELEAISKIKVQLEKNKNEALLKLEVEHNKSLLELRLTALSQINDLQDDSLAKQLQAIEYDKQQKLAAIREQFKDEAELRKRLEKAIEDHAEKQTITVKNDTDKTKLTQEETLQKLLVETAADYAGDLIGIEEKKQLALLQVQAKYAQLRINLLKEQQVSQTDEQRKESAIQIQETIKALQETNKAIKKAKKEVKDVDLYQAMGLTEHGKEQLETYVKAGEKVAELVSNLAAVFIDSVQATIDKKNEQIAQYDTDISALENKLDHEKELSEKGLANNVDAVETEVNSKRKLREQEVKDKEQQQKKLEQLQKIQLIADTVQQASSLITSSAEIFKAFASIPIVGVPLAIAAIATMFGTFAYAKIKAFQSVGSKKEQGGWIDGQPHSRGGKKYYANDGAVTELEADEFVMKKTKAKRYGRMLEAMNDGKLHEIAHSEQAFRDMFNDMGISLHNEDIQTATGAYRHVQYNTTYITNKSDNTTRQEAYLRSIDGNINYLAETDRNTEKILYEDEFIIKVRIGNRTRTIHKK